MAMPYVRVKDRRGRETRQQSEDYRDIAPIHDVESQERKDAGERDFRFFCETYFPDTFTLDWSADHLEVIRQIETSVLQGGLFATAMPRGSGKTSLCEVACIWSVVYGHREFVALIGADDGHACRLLASIKTDLETNDYLDADFPEVTEPIRRLEGIVNRCAGQLFEKERTLIGWRANRIIMPTMPKSKASGSILMTAGITASFRGMKHKRPDG